MVKEVQPENLASVVGRDGKPMTYHDGSDIPCHLLKVFVTHPGAAAVCRKCASDMKLKQDHMVAPWHDMGAGKCERCGASLWRHLDPVKLHGPRRAENDGENNMSRATETGIRKSFRQKQFEKGASLDAANDAVEGEDGDVDGDPANNYRANSSKSKRKPADADDDDQRSGDDGDIEDDSSGGTEPQVVTNGAGGYGDPALGDGSPDGDAASDNGSDDEDLNEGDDSVPVNKSAETGEEEVLTIVKAEDLMEGIHGMIRSEVQKAMGNLQAMIPAAFAGAVAEAFRREINPVNNNIVMLSKAFEDLADHVDERLDSIDTDNQQLQKAINQNVDIPHPGKTGHVPVRKSETVRLPATTEGQTLNPERASNDGNITSQELRDLVNMAKSLQFSTGQKIPGLTDVTFALESGSVSKAMIETLKNSVTEIKKAHAV